jgi:hypothetical protein
VHGYYIIHDFKGARYSNYGMHSQMPTNQYHLNQKLVINVHNWTMEPDTMSLPDPVGKILNIYTHKLNDPSLLAVTIHQHEYFILQEMNFYLHMKLWLVFYSTYSE